MDAPAFDTSRFQDTLSEAGIPLAHARAITRAVVDVTGHLPSTDALAAFKAELRAEISELRTELKTEIAGLRADMHKALADQARWTVGVILGALLVNVGAMAGIGLALYNALKP